MGPQHGTLPVVPTTISVAPPVVQATVRLPPSNAPGPSSMPVPTVSAESQPQPLPLGVAKDWVSRIAIQHQRNASLRDFGFAPAGLPDQMVGYNVNGLPVDKLNTPREIWDRFYFPPAESFAGPSNRAGAKAPSKKSCEGGRKHKSAKSKGRKRSPWSDESSDPSDTESNTDSSSNASWLDKFATCKGKITPNEHRKLLRSLASQMRETTGDDERRSQWKHKVHKVYRKQI